MNYACIHRQGRDSTYIWMDCAPSTTIHILHPLTHSLPSHSPHLLTCMLQTAHIITLLNPLVVVWGILAFFIAWNRLLINFPLISMGNDSPVHPSWVASWFTERIKDVSQNTTVLIYWCQTDYQNEYLLQYLW